MECIIIKFCVKFGKTSTKTYEMLWKADRDKAVSRAQWFKRFQEGREDVEGDPYRGWPKTTSNPELVGKACNLLTREPMDT